MMKLLNKKKYIFKLTIYFFTKLLQILKPIKYDNH